LHPAVSVIQSIYHPLSEAHFSTLTIADHTNFSQYSQPIQWS